MDVENLCLERLDYEHRPSEALPPHPMSPGAGKGDDYLRKRERYYLGGMVGAPGVRWERTRPGDRGVTRGRRRDRDKQSSHRERRWGSHAGEGLEDVGGNRMFLRNSSLLNHSVSQSGLTDCLSSQLFPANIEQSQRVANPSLNDVPVLLRRSRTEGAFCGYRVRAYLAHRVRATASCWTALRRQPNSAPQFQGVT